MATNDGDFAVTLPLIEVEMLGGATTDITLPIVEVAITGTVGAVSTVAVTIPSLTTAITGSVEHPATFAVTIPLVVAASVLSHQPTGDLDVSIPILVVSIEGIIGGTCEEYILQFEDVFDCRGDVEVEIPLIEAGIVTFANIAVVAVELPIIEADITEA